MCSGGIIAHLDVLQGQVLCRRPSIHFEYRSASGQCLQRRIWSDGLDWEGATGGFGKAVVAEELELG
jgi:hypothetical protein